MALRELCGYRAGDKGDTADVAGVRKVWGSRAGDKGDPGDVAVFAYDDETYALIVEQVTAERVRELFGDMVHGEVLRYKASNVRALNFVLRGALGGGGPKSLR